LIFNLQRGVHIGIGRLVESDVAVADLYELKAIVPAGLTEQLRGRYAAGHRPHDTGAGPCHAAQESAPVNAIGAQSVFR